MSASSSEDVLVERVDRVQMITINRPRTRNAMTRDAGMTIAEALDDLDRDPAFAVGVITGAGGTFCSGMDLKRFAEGETASIPGRGFAGVTERPPVKPLIAAVEGHALAGGFELVLACDLVVAARGAVFGLPEVRRGLVARAGGLWRLPRRVPRAVALQLILTGESIGAEEAHVWGLVNTVVDDGDAVAAAMGLANRIAANAPLALAASKRVVDESADWSTAEAFRRQAPITSPIMSSADAVEGARAFNERRAPVWEGR